MTPPIRPGSYAYKRIRKGRLQREGRWEAFKDYRAKLTAQGMSNADANKAADKAFAPGTSGPPPALPTPLVLHNQSTDALIDPGRFNREVLTSQEMFEWIAGHILAEKIVPEDAPNSQAWAMLQWVRAGNEDEFWKMYARRSEKERVDDSEGAKRNDERLLTRAVEQCRNFAAQAVAQV